MPKPSNCRREAFQRFKAQLPELDTTRGLLLAATAIASHQLQDVDPSLVEARLDGFAEAVLSRVRRQDSKALLAHLHYVLFEEERFVGNSDDYYNPLNSYLPVVVETRRGIPISLTLVYKCVAERVGLSVRGINAPGHFLASVQVENKWMLVDPFAHGRVITPDEAREQISKIIGQPVSDAPGLFEPATHHAWILRMLQNLQVVFAHAGREKDRAAMQELQEVLG